MIIKAMLGEVGTFFLTNVEEGSMQNDMQRGLHMVGNTQVHDVVACADFHQVLPDINCPETILVEGT